MTPPIQQPFVTTQEPSKQAERVESDAKYLPEAILSAITLLIVIATSLLLLASDASFTS